MKYIALIPSYCPDERLITLVKSFCAEDWIPVIVNDGSPSEYDTFFQACEPYAVILYQPENKGKGTALKNGLLWIKENMTDEAVVTTVDSDGQHTVEDASRCAHLAVKHLDSLILGMRNFDQMQVPFKSKAGNKLTEKAFRFVTGKTIHDTQTGLRSFSTNLIPFLLMVNGNRYEYEMNVLLQCADRNIPMMEVEIQTIYEGNNKSSHFHVLRDSFLIYRQLFSFILSSLSSFFLDYLLYVLFSIALHGKHAYLYANLLARAISSLFNFELNRKLVFHSDEEHMKSFVKYMFLAAGILICNMTLLYLFIDKLHMNAYLAKICTEAFLFTVSWMVQKSFVYAKGALQ